MIATILAIIFCLNLFIGATIPLVICDWENKNLRIKELISLILSFALVCILIVQLFSKIEDRAIKDYNDGRFSIVESVTNGQVTDYKYKRIKVDYD